MDALKLKNFDVHEITQTETKTIYGGGWIADFVEFLLCEYCWQSHNEAYTSTMARRGI